MNPEFQKELLGWLQGLRQVLETGATLAKEQIPLILWEKIAVDRIYYTSLVLFFVAIALVFRLYDKRVWAWANRAAYNSDGFSYPIGVVTIAGPKLVALLVLMVNSYTLATVWFAPRLYLIEWVKEMLQNAGK